MNLISFLRKKEYIDDIIIHDFKEFKYGYYMKLQCILSNNFECHIKEYVDENSRYYSYHLQNSESKMIIRWDNAPHHKKLNTYPHHIHLNDEIIDSYEITFDDIFGRIEQILSEIS